MTPQELADALVRQYGIAPAVARERAEATLRVNGARSLERAAIAVRESVERSVGIVPRPPRARPVRREAAIQRALFEWADADPRLACLYAIRNEAKRSKREGGEAKSEGMRPGMPDVCLPLPRVDGSNGACGALYLELKAPKNGPTEEQLARHDLLRAAGNVVVICWTLESAQRHIADWLALPSHPRPARGTA